MASKIRSNFSDEAEKVLNKQINMEQCAEQFYMFMYSKCLVEDMVLPGLAKYFLNASGEENRHAMKFIDYLVLRGGIPEFSSVMGVKDNYKSIKSPLDMLNVALGMEIQVNESLLEITRIASKNGDYHLEEFMQAEFLKDQASDIKELGDMIVQLDQCGGKGLGLFVWDQELLKKLS